MDTNDIRRAKLRHLISAKFDGSQAALADQCGIKPAQISRWLSETNTDPRNMSERSARQIEEKLGLPNRYLDIQEDEPNPTMVHAWENEDELDASMYVFLPQLEIKLSAGSGNLIWHIDEARQRLALPKALIDNYNIKPKCAAIVTADGYSMIPTIFNEDTVVIDYCESKQFVDGKVYALAIEERWLIKRVFKEIGGGLRIVSDNPDKTRWPDINIPTDKLEHVRIIGRCVARFGSGDL